MRPLRLKYAQRPISATRDDHGIPHVEADSWRSALYGLGYVHALDRPTQMLFARAVASGRSAEQIADKPELLESDHFFRRAGLALGLEAEVHALDDATFDAVTAYCEGVNDGMKQAGRTLPMRATGFHPAPWDQRSVLLIGNLLSFGGLAVGQQQNERLILELIQAGVDDDRLRELFSPALDNVDLALLRKVEIANRLSDDTLELITDLPRLAGSNAWALRGERTESGMPMLASDPHLEVNRLPAIWYEAVLRWDGRYAMGATLPGCPLFAVARTERLAWGVTYLKGDTSDYFIEHCRPGGVTGWQYRRNDDWRDFELREEIVLRKSGPPERARIYFNQQGTLEVDPDQAAVGTRSAQVVGVTPAEESGEPSMPAGRYLLSAAWVGQRSGVGRAIGTWIELVGAADVAAAMQAVRDCPQPTLCWMLADRQGHIGMQASGWFPKRPQHNSGLTPVAAWDPANHWQGLLPLEVLPSIYDPPCGFIASANEEIGVAGAPALVTSAVPDYRKRRIVERLEMMPRATLVDMQLLQYDVVSLQARELLEVFLPHVPPGQFKDQLMAWDCSYPPSSLDATRFWRLYRNVLLELFGQPTGRGGGIGARRMLYLASRCGYSIMILTYLDRLLLRDESCWWAGRDKGALIRRAAELAAAEPDAPWETINSFHFSNRFMGDNRWGRALGFDSAKIGMPGSHATPFQGHLLSTAKRETTFAPSYHFVTDLGQDEIWSNLPGGPSESGFSSMYKSDLQRWLTGTYKQVVARLEPS